MGDGEDEEMKGYVGQSVGVAVTDGSVGAKEKKVYFFVQPRIVVPVTSESTS